MKQTVKQLRALARPLVMTGMECSPLRSRLFWRVPARRGVAITFDDGPHPEQTPRILDVLAAHGAKATFFVLGEHALRHPELVRRALAEGHTVGNHTFSHARCSELSLSRFREEVEATDKALREISPSLQAPLFRPPYGVIRTRQTWELVRHSRGVALWSQDGLDYHHTPAEIAAMGDTLQDRDILLLHDRSPATAEALSGLLDRLERRGLSAVRL